MGLLVEGKWVDRWYDTEKTGGRFVRSEAGFRNWVTADGSPGPSGEGGFEAQRGRYHLFVSYACPWAHRTLIFRKLCGLEEMIGLSVVHPFMGDEGWTFEPGPKVVGDPIGDAKRLHQVYTRAKSDFTGRVTVPILWDRERGTIVNNESSELIRMFDGPFRQLAGGAFAERPSMYPEALREEIDAVNARVYDAINNGVYKAGFATTQDAYEEAVDELFVALDEMEARLSKQRYLVGEQVTEADWRLFTTLARFDHVYFHHFKCAKRRIRDYPNLFNYLKELYQVPGVAETTHFDHIAEHYYTSHETINPHRILPRLPDPGLDAPHDRGA